MPLKGLPFRRLNSLQDSERNWEFLNEIRGDQVAFGTPTGTTDPADKAYVDASIGGGTTPSGPAGGDLTGSYPNPTLADAELLAFKGLTSAADKLPYFTGSGTMSTTDLTPFARSILGGATAGAILALLGGMAYPFPEDTWLVSTGPEERLYFQNGGATYVKSPAGNVIIRSGDDDNFATFAGGSVNRLTLSDGASGGTPYGTDAQLVLESSGRGILQFLTPSTNDSQGFYFGDETGSVRSAFTWQPNNGKFSWYTHGTTNMELSNNQLQLANTTSIVWPGLTGTPTIWAQGNRIGTYAQLYTTDDVIARADTAGQMALGYTPGGPGLNFGSPVLAYLYSSGSDVLNTSARLYAALGLDSGGYVVSAVANGVAATDAVNKSQLTAADLAAQGYAAAAQAYAIQRANHTGTQLAATISDFDTQVRTNRLDQMAAPTSDVSWNHQNITNLADPINLQDAVTYGYMLDGDVASALGLDIKQSVRVASNDDYVEAVFSSSGASGAGALTIDGVTLDDGDRVLLTDQASYRSKSLELNPEFYVELDAQHGKTDLGGSGYTTTSNGGITYGGLSSSALRGVTKSTDFDGVDDGFSTNYNPFVNSTTRTFTGWIWKDGTATQCLWGDGGPGEVALQVTSTQISLYTSVTAGFVKSWSYVLPTNTWTHYVIVANESTNDISLYINGSLVSTISTAWSWYASPVSIRYSMYPAQIWDGRMQAQAVYEYGLDAAQVSALYQTAQTNRGSSENGIYTYSEAGVDFGESGQYGVGGTYGDTGSGWTLTRPPDSDEDQEFGGMFVPVWEGTTNTATLWLCTTPDPIVVGTTPIEIIQFRALPTGPAGGDLTGTYPNPTISPSAAVSFSSMWAKGF